MKKTWKITEEEIEYEISIRTGFGGKLSFSINGEDFVLPKKHFTFLFGRKENFKLGDHLAILVIKPFGRADLVVGGRFVSNGKAYH